MNNPNNAIRVVWALANSIPTAIESNSEMQKYRAGSLGWLMGWHDPYFYVPPKD